MDRSTQFYNDMLLRLSQYFFFVAGYVILNVSVRRN